MKKLMILLLVSGMSLWSNSLFAQNNIPQNVLDHFHSKYANAKVHEWDRESDGFEVEFTLNGKKWDGYYNTAGEWLRSERDIRKRNLPSAVLNALSKSTYSTWKIDDVEEHQTPAHATLYEIEVKNNGRKAYLYFLPDGKMIK